MLSRIYAPALASLDEELIEIECDLASGLPGFVMVGLADKSVDEARERVRSAIKNSRLTLKTHHSKSGSGRYPQRRHRL